MLPNLAGKAALVTGSTSGIGLAAIKKIAQAGANVCLNGFGDINQIEKVRKDIEKDYGVKCIYINSDLSSAQGCTDLIDQFNQQFGGVDILVNNAGMQHTANIEDFPEDKYHKIIELNLNSVFYLSKAVIPYMKQQNWGRIVNVASAHGLVGSVQKAPYVASKHGVIGMTKVKGLELAPTGISVNALCPGFVMTDLIKQQIDNIKDKEGISFEQAQYELLKPKQPSLQGIPPEHIADGVLFLCSETAGSMKGTALVIDGGWVAQ